MKKTIKKIVVIICTVALLVGILPAAGAVNQAQTATLYTADLMYLPGFRNVSTSSFYTGSDTEASQMETSVTVDGSLGEMETVKSYPTMKDMQGAILESHHNTLLSMKVQFEKNQEYGNNSYTRLEIAGAEVWQGFQLSVEGYQLRLETVGNVQDDPGIFRLQSDTMSSITEEFIFQMSFEYGDYDDDGEANDVKLGIYINGKPATGEFIQGNAEADGYYAMFYDCDMKKLGTHMTLYTQTDEIAGALTVSGVMPNNNSLSEITWSDFVDVTGEQAENATFSSTTPDDSSYYLDIDQIDRLANTAFETRIKFLEAGYDNRIYIGGAHGWNGMQLCADTDGTLLLIANPDLAPDLNFQNEDYVYVFEPTVAGVDSFLNREVTLKITTEYGDYNDDGDDSDVQLGFYFNGKLYNNQYCYADGYKTSDKAGNYVGICATEGGIVIKSAGQTVYLDGFRNVTTSSFYNTEEDVAMSDCVRVDGGADAQEEDTVAVYHTMRDMQGNDITSHHKTLVSLHVDFEKEAESGNRIEIAGAEDNKGFRMYPEVGGWHLESIESLQSQYSAFRFYTDNVDSILDAFNLQLSFEYGDYDEGGTVNDVKIGVYINGTLCTGEVLTGDIAVVEEHAVFYNCDMEQLGSFMKIYTEANENAGDITVSALSVKNKKLNRITWSDFSDEDGEMVQDMDFSAPEHEHSVYNMNKGGVNNLESTIFEAKVKFASAGENNVLYFGGCDGWHGMMLYPVHSGELAIVAVPGLMPSLNFTENYFLLNPDVAGVDTFINKEFILNISVEYGDYDGDNDSNDVQLGFYINGELYNNQYCYANDYKNSELIGNYIGVYTGDSVISIQSSGKSWWNVSGEVSVNGVCTGSQKGVIVFDMSDMPNATTETVTYTGFEAVIDDGTERKEYLVSATADENNKLSFDLVEYMAETKNYKVTVKAGTAVGKSESADYSVTLTEDYTVYQDQSSGLIYEKLGNTCLLPGQNQNAGAAAGDLYLVGDDLTGSLQEYTESECWGLYLIPLNAESGVYRNNQKLEEGVTIQYPTEGNVQYYIGVGENKEDGDIFTIQGEFLIVNDDDRTTYKGYQNVIQLKSVSYQYEDGTWNWISGATSKVSVAGDVANGGDANGIYLKHDVDSLKFIIQDWNYQIYPISDKNSGIYMNGEKQDGAHLIETLNDGLYLSLSQAAEDGDCVTLKGVFRHPTDEAQTGRGISYDETDFWYATDIPQYGTDELISTWYDIPIGTSPEAGDINADGTLSITDVVRMKRWYAGERVPIRNTQMGADINYTSAEDSLMSALRNKLVEHEEMPIGAFYGPHNMSLYWDDVYEIDFPHYLTERYFQLTADAGINTITYSDLDYNAHPDDVEYSLDMAEKYGLTYYINDSAVTSMAQKDTSVDRVALAAQVAKYADHPAFGGLHLVDEPNTDYYMADAGDKNISKYANLTTSLKELEVPYFSAILPRYTTTGTKESYERYVDEFSTTFKPQLLVYDFYPFNLRTTESSTYESYFWNMDLIRKKAKQAQVPFGVVIQAGGNWANAGKYFETEKYYPNKGQFNWNVSTCLAFGAKFVEYFPLIQPVEFAYAGTCKEDNKWDFDRNGLIGADGEVNEWYGYAKKNNQQIAAVDHVLMKAESCGVIVSGIKAETDMVDATDNIITSGDFIDLFTFSENANALVGCFDYDGKKALYVVNYDMANDQSMTLTFKDTVQIEKVQQAKTSYTSAQSITLDMEAGEGILLVIQ